MPICPKPSTTEITAARDALIEVQAQDLHISPEAVAWFRAAVETLNWVLGAGPAPQR